MDVNAGSRVNLHQQTLQFIFDTFENIKIHEEYNDKLLKGNNQFSSSRNKVLRLSRFI